MKAINNLNSVETKLLPYDQAEFLNYINSGEIPPILIDLLDRINVCIFFYEPCCVTYNYITYKKNYMLCYLVILFLYIN
jgi:hypothetical protein